ncbi:MAG TPA: asparagine synthase (glutamine-hydrolyzing) [Pyrinomonadaceae bacterium]|nr:asparagine synthase (glutamine-hydrolyzing) [Pyrinomonadaceae bacterium]
MCSISGILGRVSRDAVVRMNQAQRHRGPDDCGIASCGAVLLGNTRLAIIDTSTAGHQPMNDPQTGNWITYNGETYNFKDLRHELDQEAWCSDTDTEVVLRAYAKWGIDAFRKLCGMFALAIWDDQRQTLLLARDPLGIKPLYYYADDQQFIFASELRALLASGLVPRKLSTAGVDSYLANGSVAAPLTIIDGVKQLLPGHCLQVNGQIELRDIEFAIPDSQSFDGNRDEAVARLRSELEESVRLHLLSDVPLGVFLSGGMDSSALVALITRISDQRPKTFSVVFDEAAYTEAPFSRAVAERFKTDHSEIRLSEDRLLDILPTAINAIDQPTMDGINTFVVSSAVKREGITVALSGLGGDELFAGYPSFRRALKFAAMSQGSKRFLRAASGVGKFALNGSVQRQKFWQLLNSDGEPQDVYRISRQLFSTDAVAELTGREASNHSSNGHRHDNDIVNTISRLELRGYMTNTLLRDTDAMSMAHSLEVRVPFLSVRLVDFVLSLPGEWKLRGGDGPKPLLADVMSDLLPREFTNRPKMGFTLPFEKWMQGKMRAEIAAVLGDEQRLSLAGLNSETVGKVWRRFLEKPKAVGWSRPWAIYVLVKWCETNGIRQFDVR